MATGPRKSGSRVLPPTTVRRATRDDLPRLTPLLDRYFREWDIWERDSPADLATKLTAPTLGCFVAEQDGELLGCVFGHPCPSVAAAAECKRLYVQPEGRGHGLAIRLMEHLERQATDEGFVWMYLDTKEEFAAAIQLYVRLGYEPCARYNDNAQATMFFRKRLR